MTGCVSNGKSTHCVEVDRKLLNLSYLPVDSGPALVGVRRGMAQLMAIAILTLSGCRPDCRETALVDMLLPMED